MQKRLSFDSRIIEHMGKDLITAPEVAVIELIKNSIDAKSKIINFKIHSELNTEILPSCLKMHQGILDIVKELSNRPFLLFEDFGKGMNERTLDEGFLKVGTQIKLKEDDVLFGQKGIGRLAAQRLGNTLVVETTQKKDSQINIVIIDWNKITSEKIDNISVPFFTSPKDNLEESYTRLWILDAKIDDVVNRPQQQLLFIDSEMIELKEEVASALAFLVSPYGVDKGICINVYYDNILIPSAFDSKFLEVAESIHSFKLFRNDKGKLQLDMHMQVKPFFIAKTHKTRLGNNVDFSLYKLSVDAYSSLYEKYIKRYEDSLTRTMDQEQLICYFEDKQRRIYRSRVTKDKKERFEKYIHQIAINQIKNLDKITEISGEIYSFKRDNIVGALYLDFLKEEYPELFKDVSIRHLQNFLKNFNGVKLYRNAYRIGFLGNKDNDWIEMQQYRTMGQQFYRFNLGDTLGFVKINDDNQEYIKEISSRLDIYSDDISRTFKDFINYIFNEFFYQFNRSADEVTRNILFEEGLIEENIQEKVKKATDETAELLRKNKKLLDKISRTKKLLNDSVVFSNNTASIPTKLYKDTVEALDEIAGNSDNTDRIIKESQRALSISNDKLKQIEIETFNNFKLMSNGLITESITHELHSVITDDGFETLTDNWDGIGDYLIANNVLLYNDEFIPLREAYDTVIAKIDDVGNLYDLLENTFIKGDSKTDYALENLSETISKIEKTLIKDLQKNKIRILYENMNFVRALPKGVMLHVFYNLITNSKYWIDYRRKHSKLDYSYSSEETMDYICIDSTQPGVIEISDTGTGVLPHMEHVLFGALQSGKEANKGRGMGLYIVKRFLNSFEADIILSEERNKYGNRYKFIITLPE